MTARSRRIGRAARPVLVVAFAGVLLTGCGSETPELSGVELELPETAVAYQVETEGMPSEEMAELAVESLSVYRYRDRGANSLALLRRRAENDVETLQQILRSYGYYNGTAEVAVEEISEDEYEEDEPAVELPSFSDLLFWRDSPPDIEDVAQSYARVLITVDPGTQFTLIGHELRFIDPESGATVPSAQALGSPVGGPAVAVPIVGAEAAAVEILKRNGYPYAERIDRDAAADLALATLEVESQLFSGPSAVWGPVEFEGLEDVKESYLRTYIPWDEGQPISREDLQVFTRELLATDLFDTAVVTLPEEPPEVEGPVALPVRVVADERPFRTVSAGGEYSTDAGPSATFGFQHRNLWGENETITLDADLGLELQRLLVGYREPQYGRPGQDLIAGLELVHEEDDAFDELRGTLTAGFEREVSDEWKVGFGGLAEASRITEDGIERDAYLGGIPLFAAYDDTDDLLNPTAGHRARFEVTPFAGVFDSEFTSFLKLDTNASTYWDILDDDRYVLAGRVRLASIVADELADVPKNRRLYAGGGGSVRGYGRRLVGPLDADNDPIGGLSAFEASLEMRARIWGDIGGVAFVDAGQVDTDSIPGFDDVLFAAGLGVRYFSPAGPIRLDIAFPVNGRDVDDAFQLYFSIGQAF